MRISRLLSLAAALGLAAAPDRLAAQAYELDHASSHVRFRGRAMLQSVTGNSQSLRGSIVLRDNEVRTARGDVRFPVTSLRTDPGADARELVQLFGGRDHPEIIFLLDSIGGGDRGAPLHIDGHLVMNGVARPVRFVGTAVTSGARVVAQGETRVDVRRWGIAPPSRLRGLIRMSPELALSFRAEFRSRPPRGSQIAVDH